MISFKNQNYFELMVLKDFKFLQAETDFEVVIIDFGFGKQLDSFSLKINSHIVASKVYWAPESREVVEEHEGFANSISDVFSIAGMLA